jgi:hypothetical protein
MRGSVKVFVTRVYRSGKIRFAKAYARLRYPGGNPDSLGEAFP